MERAQREHTMTIFTFTLGSPNSTSLRTSTRQRERTGARERTSGRSVLTYSRETLARPWDREVWEAETENGNGTARWGVVRVRLAST